MLQSKTKRVATYGRRGRTRVVAVLDRSSWKSSETSPSRQETSSTDASDEDFPSTISHLASPVPSKVSQSNLGSKPSRENTGCKVTSHRKPLASLAVNALSSPATAQKLSKAQKISDARIQVKLSKAKAKSKVITPYIDVDDHSFAGMCSNAEETTKRRRSTHGRGNAALATKKRASLKGKETVIFDLSSDDDQRDAPRPGQPRKQASRIIVLSDTESTSDAKDSPHQTQSQCSSPSRSTNGTEHAGSSMPTRKLEVEVVIPVCKSLSKSLRISPRRTPQKSKNLSQKRQNIVGTGLQQRERQTAPNGRALPAIMSPYQVKRTIEVYDVNDTFSSLDQELDVAVKMAGLHLNESNKPPPKLSSQPSVAQAYALPQKRKTPAAYLRPILSECGQLTPFDFDVFLSTLPTELMFVNIGNAFTSTTSSDTFTKVGEASYSEVFGFGNVVLKIVPLLDEGAHPLETWSASWDSPQVSIVDDVVREINVTRAMGETCKGFIKLIKAHVVQGPYPGKLLACWDEFEGKNGSEGVRPDHFSDVQAYAIIVLPNGGPDLEAFSFAKTVDHPKFGWLQACSIFWQVAKSLATAEDLLHFEHRDLHWGQILVRYSKKSSRFGFLKVQGLPPIDDPRHGISTTIIDLGLSRINQGRGESFWTPFDAEIFEGEGDYQYDVYRMMREHNGDEWESFQPLTNVMWLHYVLDKLLHHKGLRAPGRSRRSSVTTGTEEELRAYECVKGMDILLGNAVYPMGRKVGAKIKKRAGSSNLSEERIDSATAVVRLGQAYGWIL